MSKRAACVDDPCHPDAADQAVVRATSLVPSHRIPYGAQGSCCTSPSPQLHEPVQHSRLPKSSSARSLVRPSPYRGDDAKRLRHRSTARPDAARRLARRHPPRFAYAMGSSGPSTLELRCQRGSCSALRARAPYRKSCSLQEVVLLTGTRALPCGSRRRRRMAQTCARRPCRICSGTRPSGGAARAGRRRGAPCSRGCRR